MLEFYIQNYNLFLIICWDFKVLARCNYDDTSEQPDDYTLRQNSVFFNKYGENPIGYDSRAKNRRHVFIRPTNLKIGGKFPFSIFF